MSRRSYKKIEQQPLPPFYENLVFWAPLTEGDLTDHISGNTIKATGYGSLINIKHIIAALILTLLTAMAITEIYHTAASRTTATTATMQWSADTCRWGDGWMR